MSTYIVSYDPIGPGKKLDALVAQLQSYPKSLHALAATWFVTSDDTAFKIAAAIEEILDDDDGVIVNKVQREAAWAASLSKEIDTWLTENL